jgi:hypothetical protein
MQKLSYLLHEPSFTLVLGIKLFEFLAPALMKAWTKRYKIFYYRKLRMFVPGKPFQPNLMFASKVRAKLG